MKFSILTFGLFLTITLFTNCGNDKNTSGEDAGTEQVDGDKILEPKVKKITKEAILLSDGSKIDFPAAESGVSVIFITQPGQHDLLQTGMVADLTEFGYKYADDLKNYLHEVDIHAVMAIGTRYAQNTGRPTADDHDTKVYAFNNVDYGPFLDYVYHTEKGKKFLVVELGQKLNDLIYTLTAGVNFDIPENNAYDEIYVVFSPQRGKATVHKLKF